jgi:hypothetical protein
LFQKFRERNMIRHLSTVTANYSWLYRNRKKICYHANMQMEEEKFKLKAACMQLVFL